MLAPARDRCNRRLGIEARGGNLDAPLIEVR